MNIKELLERGDKEGAIKWCDLEFAKNPDSEEAAFYFANLMANSEHPGPAKFILEALAEKNPGKWQAWQNLGYCLNELGLYDRALKALRKAQKLNPSNPDIYVGLSSCYTHLQEWDRAIKYADKALAIKEVLQAQINKAFAYLCLGRYGEGWDLYEKGIGRMPWRDWHDYGLEDGLGKTVVYAEQGLGDQIAFCSALQDAIADGKVAAVNCHPKLERLYRNSFDVPVYGDQFNDSVPWVDSVGATHQWPMSGLMGPYRRHERDFPRRPFLKADKDESYMWKALLESKSARPKVGIAWTGGTKGSHGGDRRNLDAAGLARMMDIPGVDWVCLEYTDKAERPEGMMDFPWATQTGDYADTAALVENLEAVICVATSVYHLCGALGVPAYVVVHENPHFHEAPKYSPYYGSVTFYKRSELGLDGAIDSARESLCAYLSALTDVSRLPTPSSSRA